jgi:hypothetical protein
MTPSGSGGATPSRGRSLAPCSAGTHSTCTTDPLTGTARRCWCRCPPRRPPARSPGSPTGGWRLSCSRRRPGYWTAFATACRAGSALSAAPDPDAASQRIPHHRHTPGLTAPRPGTTTAVVVRSCADRTTRCSVCQLVGVVPTPGGGATTVRSGIASGPLGAGCWGPGAGRGGPRGAGGRLGPQRPRAAGAGSGRGQRPSAVGLAVGPPGIFGPADTGQRQPVGAARRRGRRPGRAGWRLCPSGAAA